MNSTSPTISLSMIVKNVDKIIGPCLETVASFVDEILIADTGSSDKTKSQILRVAPQAKILDYTDGTFLLDKPESFDKELPGPWSEQPFLADFGAARQFALEQCTGDYVLWMDSDDVLVDGKNLRYLVEQMAADRCETAMLLYRCGWVNGRNTVAMRRDRIIKRDPRVRWVCPVHEVLYPSFSRKNYDICSITQAFGNHPSKALGPKVHLRNLKILRHWVTHTHVRDLDTRLLYYLADEEQYMWPDEALKHFQLCYRLGTFDAQAAKAHLAAGRLYEKKAFAAEVATKEEPKAIAAKRIMWTSLALGEYTNATKRGWFDPDGYFALAGLYHKLGRHKKCVEWTQRAMNKAAAHDDRDILPFNTHDRGWRAMLPYAKSLIFFGKFEPALKAIKAALEQNPSDIELQNLQKICWKSLGYALV